MHTIPRPPSQGAHALRSFWLPLSLLLGWLLAGPASGANLEAQRRLFLETERALQAGDGAALTRARRDLADYPLLPYLEYQAIKGRLTFVGRQEVDRFLEAYPDSPLSDQVRDAWLAQLAKQGRWQEYLDYYQASDSPERRCQQAQALLATGRGQDAHPQIELLWLTGESLPSACDPVFEAWRRAGQLTAELAWKRFGLAMDKGEIPLARHLKRFLGGADQVWADRWLRVHENPRLILDGGEFASAHPQREAILLHGLERLSKQGAGPTENAWNSLRQRYRFSSEGDWRGQRTLGLALIKAEPGDLLRRLDPMQPPATDLRFHQRRLLAALKRKDWNRLLTWIDALPPLETAEEAQWRYWKGRALQALGRQEESRRLLTEVAQDRTYYAFLAADRIDKPYFLEHKPLTVEQARLTRLAALPGARCARELLALNRKTDARREWRKLTQDMGVEDLKAAARLAQQWNWPDQSIFTLARSKYWDDLELRFPLKYQDLVTPQAEKYGLPTAWLMAIMRQESAFAEDARSRVGALGLMQLMPDTANMMARRLGQKTPTSASLVQPRENIPLGAAYLHQVYRQLDRHPVLASAAYNAGAGNVRRWLPDQTQDAEIWVEHIPFGETRDYVRRVMAYAIIYEKRLGQRPASIAARMRPIPGNLERASATGLTGRPEG